MIIHMKGDVIEVKGSLMANHWPALRSAVSLLLGRHPSGVIVDGSELTEINEPGARTFLDASSYIEAHRARVVIAGLPDTILQQISRMPGARSQLPLAQTIEEARASLAVGGTEAVPEVRRKPTILVPLLGEWKRAIDFAAAHADKHTEIQLLYIIEVPRDQPMGVPLPDLEQHATAISSAVEALAKQKGIAVRTMTSRARVAIEGVTKMAADIEPRLLITAYSKDELVKETNGHNLVRALCCESPGDVGLFCLSPGGRSSRKIVLVPLLGVWSRALELAEEQAAAGKAELHILYVIEVPRTLPLDGDLPEEESIAHQTLSEAQGMVKNKRLDVRTELIRGRDVLEAAAKFSAQNPPELMVTAYLKRELIEIGARTDTVSLFCQESSCDVAIYCVTG